MRKLTTFLASLTLALTWSTAAKADSIGFDPTGSGGPYLTVDVFDWLPGNSILQINPLDPTTGTILFQANLGVATLGNNVVVANGAGGNFFTVVAEFGVNLLGGGNFTVNSGGEFSIFANDALANDLAGTGFTSGTEILSGTAISGLGAVTLAGAPTQPPPTGEVSPLCAPNGPLVNCLDQHNVNNYPNFYTFSAIGSTIVGVRVTDVDESYFEGIIENLTFSITSTQGALPYTQVDPSAMFWNGAIGVPSVCGPGQLGTAASPCVNGSGSNIMAETDASTTFRTTQVEVIPEPASLLLLGSGLVGAAAARRRSRKKA